MTLQERQMKSTQIDTPVFRDVVSTPQRTPPSLSVCVSPIAPRSPPSFLTPEDQPPATASTSACLPAPSAPSTSSLSLPSPPRKRKRNAGDPAAEHRQQLMNMLKEQSHRTPMQSFFLSLADIATHVVPVGHHDQLKRGLLDCVSNFHPDE